MPPGRSHLEARLRIVRLQLLLRGMLRTALTALGVGGVGLAVGALFMVILPRILTGSSLGISHVVAVGAIGFVAALVLQLRVFRVPTLMDAALSMEARLSDDTGALGAALVVPEDSAFTPPVVAQAEQDLELAEDHPAPALMTTRRLVWIPAACVLGTVTLAYVFTLPPPERTDMDRDDAARTAGTWTEVDVGGGRSEEDRRVVRDALGLEEAAAALARSAATLRDATASESAQRDALEDARAALDRAETAGLPTGEPLPESVPTDPEAREMLVNAIENAASGAGRLADDKRNAAVATRDTGRDGERESFGAGAELVPFPAPEVSTTGELPTEAMALQSPARRALADRAVRAYENLQQP